MRCRIRIATRDRLERYAHSRRQTAGAIFREATEAYSGENLRGYYAECARLNSTMVSYPSAIPEGVRADSLINWHMDNAPPVAEPSPITVDPEDLKQMIPIKRYTKPPHGTTGE